MIKSFTRRFDFIVTALAAICLVPIAPGRAATAATEPGTLDVATGLPMHGVFPEAAARFWR